ncbi:MAG: type IV toxin-antitoxin system AbiEi family antitoxin [Actinomycetota bacterium]
MWNKALSETELLRMFTEALKSRLPEAWNAFLNVQPVRGRPGSGWRPDALLEIEGPEGQRTTLIVKFKRRIDPKDVPAVLDQMRRYGPADALVVAPFLSPRTRERLAEAGAAYADATGNWRLALDRPALFIERWGADANPWPDERPLRSLKGPTAGRVMRALCDFKPPYGVRDLAERSQTPLASVARVVELLDREAIVKRKSRGPIESVDWPGLLRRWAQDYAFTKSNRTETFLNPRGTIALLDKLRDLDSRYAVTGSLAAAKLATVAPARLAQVYVTSLSDAAAQLDLRLAESGANVILAEPFDDVVFDRTTNRDEVSYAAASQVAADLFTSPGRGPTEGNALIAWMEQNEEAWRS